MTQQQDVRAAPVFAALGDDMRLGLVSRLSREGPLSIAKLTTGSEVSRQAVTKHLRVLAEAGLASSRQKGRERIWELEPRALLEARAYLDKVSAHWDVVLNRLRDFVEQPEEPSKNRGATQDTIRTKKEKKNA